MKDFESPVRIDVNPDPLVSFPLNMSLKVLSKKRKREDHSASASTVHFLLLPSEIRLQIYQLCYQPCVCDTASRQEKRDKADRSESKKLVRAKPRERSFFEKSRCKHPYLHQSLLLTSRQIHIDVWPLYVSCHSLGFTHPIKFANDFLSFQPPDRLKLIKHLSLYIADDSKCYNPASTSGFRSLVSDVGRLISHYPDMFFNLLSFTWETCDSRKFHLEERRMNLIAMYEAIVIRLLEHYQRERLQAGVAAETHRQEGDETPMMWRVGMVARKRRFTIDKVDRRLEKGSMVFFECLPDQPDARQGLRYFDVARWLGEHIPGPRFYMGQRVTFSVSHDQVPFPSYLRFRAEINRHTQPVYWSAGAIDWKSGTDKLKYSYLLDVGPRFK